MINVGDGEFVDPEQLWLNLYIFSTYKPDTQCLIQLGSFPLAGAIGSTAGFGSGTGSVAHTEVTGLTGSEGPT